ncbi:alpha/beta fold hydrolase [Cellulomonas soli]
MRDDTLHPDLLHPATVDPEAARPARPDWIDPTLYPFTTTTRTLGEHVVHLIDQGTGPTLLMLHGNPTWSAVYGGLVARLSDEFRCVVPDLPGFGLSRAPEGFDGRVTSLADVVTDLVRDLDLRDVVLVLQDWGGPIGLDLAAREPGRIRGIVVANTWAWPITGDRHFERFSQMMGGAPGAFLVRHANLFVNLMVPLGHRRRRLGRAEMRLYRGALGTPARRQASAVLPREIVHATELLSRVERSLPDRRDVPALVLWADRDIAFRDAELQRWRHEWPHAEVVEIPGAGHFVQSDAPQECADAIRDWYRRTVADAVTRSR